MIELRIKDVDFGVVCFYDFLSADRIIVHVFIAVAFYKSPANPVILNRMSVEY